MLITIHVRTFTGKSVALEVEPTDTVARVKELLSERKVFRVPVRTLGHKGHELRDHRQLSHYNVDTGDTLNILPPSSGSPQISLQFEKEDGTRFEILVKRDISIGQLKREISIEEKIDVNQINVVSTQQQLDDDALIYTYSLDGELLSVLAQPYTVTVTNRGTKTTICVQASEPIVQVIKLIDVNPSVVHADDLQFKWNGEIIDKNRSFVNHGILSGSELELIAPTAFKVQLAIEGTKLDVIVKQRQTLREFRDAVLSQHDISILNHVLVSVDRELKMEGATIEELGILPGYTIYAVTDVDVHIIGGPEDFDIVVNPLTRISDIRKILAGLSNVDLSQYWFTQEGILHLNESRRLYDLGISSSGTLILRVPLLPLTIRVWGGLRYEIEADENDTVAKLKGRITLITGIPVYLQRLCIRGKIREENLTLKKHGLVGGEELILFIRLSDFNDFRAQQPEEYVALPAYDEAGPSENIYHPPFHEVDSYDAELDLEMTMQEEALEHIRKGQSIGEGVE